MNASTLQALRRMLCFSRPEAAHMIASSVERPRGISDRAWRQLENGEYAVHQDIALNIRQLADWRCRSIAAIEALLHDHPHGQLAVVWYESLDDWMTLAGHEPVYWRPQQSVIGHILAQYPERTTLVLFDSAAYAVWLNGRMDSEGMRAGWAEAVACA